MTGASINAPSCHPFPYALEGDRFTSVAGLVFTLELSPAHRHIKLRNLQTIRLGPVSIEVVSCSVADDPFRTHLKIELQPRRPSWKGKSPS